VFAQQGQIGPALVLGEAGQLEILDEIHFCPPVVVLIITTSTIMNYSQRDVKNRAADDAHLQAFGLAVWASWMIGWW
jgi:hypothetical protein